MRTAFFRYAAWALVLFATLALAGPAIEQIAEKIGKTDVATRVLLSRSMRQLEKQLEDVKPTR